MPTTMIPQPRIRTLDGVRIRYADSGGSPDPVLLLTSPWPESVYAFAPIWATSPRVPGCSRLIYPGRAGPM